MVGPNAEEFEGLVEWCAMRLSPTHVDAKHDCINDIVESVSV
jgi:hypothetical protein